MVGIKGYSQGGGAKEVDGGRGQGGREMVG